MEKSIGIGCFHFGIKKEIPFNFKGEEYLIKLKDCLSNLNNVKNINIEVDESFKKVELNIKKELPRLDKKDGFFPYLDPYSEISFEIFIPFRIQAQFWGIEEKHLNTHTENFKVTIKYSFDFPVAIIEPLNPTKTSDASKAVSIVWHFLEKEINNKEQEEYIKFELIGPSPFHIDLIIRPETPEESDEEWLINPEYIYSKGYDNYYLNYNVNLIKNSDEAFQYLEDSIVEEFGLFYKFKQLRVEKYHSWRKINKKIKKLRKANKLKSFKRIFFNLFQRGKIIGKINNGIIDFETDSLFIKNMLDKELKDLYIQEPYFFKEPIEKEINEDYEYPVQQTKELLSFIENRRVKNIELIIALISAIIGGIIGAILTNLTQ